MKRISRTLPGRSASGLAQAKRAPWEARFCEMELRLTQLESEKRRLRADRERLETASANYAKLYDLAPVGLVTLDTRGKILSMNHTGAALLGRDQARLLERRFDFLVAPDDVPKFSAHLRESQRSNKITSQELHLQDVGGKPVLVQLATVAVVDENSHVTQLEMTFVDLTERKRVEEELRLSEDRFRTLARRAPVGIFMSNSNGDAVYVNETWCAIAGLKPEQALGKGWLNAVHPEDRKRIESGWQEAVSQGNSSTTEFRFVRPVGVVTWVLGNAVKLRSPKGDPMGYVGTIADITARKQAEKTLRMAHDELEARVRGRTLLLTEANKQLESEIAERKLAETSLRESEERFRLLVSGIHDYAIYMLDSKGGVASWNAGAKRIKGYGAKEIIGQHFSRFFPREDVQRGKPQRLLRAAIKSGHVEDENWRVRKDGSRFWAQVAITALRDEHGRLKGFSKVTRDITERRHAQEALRESEDRLRAILDNSPAIIFLKDRRGRYLHFNREFERAFKAPLQKNIGKTDAEIFSPEQAIAFRANDRKVLLSGVSRVFDEVALHSDGPHNSIVTKYPLRDAEGKIYAIGGIVTDITERRRAEEALRESEKSLSDFFEQAPLGLFWVSPQGRVQHVNRAQLDLLGCTLKQCLNRHLSEFFVDPELAVEALKRLAQHGTLQNFRARLHRRDGDIRHVLMDANGLWRMNEFLYSRWFVRDITHRVELEQEILAISEREQKRLGNDLHDDLCQQLSGIEFLSQTLAEQLAASSRHEAARAREIAGMVRQAMDRTRELARGLSPVRLVEDGLMLALRELAERTERLFHITCNFRCYRPVLINDETVGIHLYRIAQEAISNAIRHGKARRVDIGLNARAGDLVLAVGDNGVGFPVRLRRRKGMGLRVMQYRSSVLGGSLVVQRHVNGGTSVVCTVKNSSHPRRTTPRKLV